MPSGPAAAIATTSSRKRSLAAVHMDDLSAKVECGGFVLTALILLACKAIPFIGLRPSTDKEDLGLDYSLHNTKAYQDDLSGSGAGTATPSKVKDVENSM